MGLQKQTHLLYANANFWDKPLVRVGFIGQVPEENN